MAGKKPTDKNTKAEILQAYEELAKETAGLKTQLTQVPKDNQTVNKDKPKIEQTITMNKPPTIQQKMNFTIESLAKIQLGFGSAANELSEQLTTQASKLSEIRQDVETEVADLKQLHNLEIADDTLDTLITAYEDNSKTYQEEYSQRYEVLSQEILEQRITWQKAQEEYKQSIKEQNDMLRGFLRLVLVSFDFLLGCLELGCWLDIRF